MPLAVDKDEAAHPIRVRLPGPHGVVPQANRCANLMQKFRLAPRSDFGCFAGHVVVLLPGLRRATRFIRHPVAFFPPLCRPMVVRRYQRIVTSIMDPTSQNPYQDKLQIKLEKAIALKDYAISRNFDVPDEVIKALNAAAQSPDLSDNADSIDTAIRDLTTLTYPTTTESVFLAGTPDQENPAFKRFFRTLLGIGVFMLFMTLISFAQTRSADQRLDPSSWSYLSYLLDKAMLPIFLGALGSVTYIIFNVVGILSEKAFEREDTDTNYARLLLGGVLGWVFYFAFCQSAFDNLAGQKAPTKGDALLLMLPFMAGFSTKLVVGLLNQMVRAIELTLGLEEKGTQLAQRKTKRTGGKTR